MKKALVTERRPLEELGRQHGTLALIFGKAQTTKKPANEAPWTRKLGIYDLRTNLPSRSRPTRSSARIWTNSWRCPTRPTATSARPTSSPENPNGRWRVYDYEDLVARDKASLDIFWLRDDSLVDTDNLPPPEVIAQEIVDDLEAALEQFRLIAGDFNGGDGKAVA